MYACVYQYVSAYIHPPERAVGHEVPILWSLLNSHIFLLRFHAVFLIFGRFIKILDSVLHHLVPAWDHTLGTFSKLKVRPAYFQCTYILLANYISK